MNPNTKDTFLCQDIADYTEQQLDRAAVYTLDG